MRRRRSEPEAGSPPRARRIAALVYPGAQVLDVTGPLEVFSSANRMLAHERGADAAAYSVELIGLAPGPVRVSGGLRLVAERSFRHGATGVDTLIVPGAVDVRPLLQDEVLHWLRRSYPRLRRLVSVCSGALVLAEAGLLDGRRATTHWETCPRLAAAYPRVVVEHDSIFVRDGNVYTSAGITAGIDLALALVEEDLGRRVALATARELVVFLKRPGGQSQFSARLLAQMKEAGEFDALIDWIFDHLDGELSVETLARRSGMSPRNFARVFKRKIGVTPAKFVELARVDEARRRLADSDAPLKAVATETGFGSVERMRRTFDRHLQLRPSDYRRLH